jgi:hypothetical protein
MTASQPGWRARQMEVVMHPSDHLETASIHVEAAAKILLAARDRVDKRIQRAL